MRTVDPMHHLRHYAAQASESVDDLVAAGGVQLLSLALDSHPQGAPCHEEVATAVARTCARGICRGGATMLRAVRGVGCLQRLGKGHTWCTPTSCAFHAVH